MCLYLPKNAKIKKAKKDITVYKVGKLDDWRTNQDIYFNSIYYPYTYILNKLPAPISIYTQGREVNRGYHSYCSARTAMRKSKPPQAVGKFIIPKGAKYYEGTFWGVKNRVSNLLIFKGWIK